MGRKIPAKKHRGVKNPLEQQARRWQSLKTKINAPPKDPDDQPVPRSLINLFAFSQVHTDKSKQRQSADMLPGRERAAAGRHKAKARAGGPADRRSAGSGPTGRGPEGAAGRRPADRRPAAKDSATSGLARKMSRAQKLAVKRDEKKKQAMDEARYERVPFGARAHSPPHLSARPSLERKGWGARGLLLAGRGAGEGEGEGEGRGAGEEARLAAVAAYRALKAQRHRNKKRAT